MGLQRSRVNRQHRRRAPRASQACDYCAISKARCDNNPRCQRCLKRNIPCVRPFLVDDQQSLGTEGPGQSQPLGDHVVEELTSSSTIREASSDDNARSETDPSSSMTSESLFDTAEDPLHQPEDINSGNPTEGGAQLQLGDDKEVTPISLTDFFIAPFIHDLFPRLQECHIDELQALSGSLFDMSDVTMAFGKTVGHWDPDCQNHRAAEEGNIYLEPTSHESEPALARPSGLMNSKAVSSDTRDEILAMILKNCERDNVMKVASAFPSAEVMGQFLLRFLDSHALNEDTWIHIPTFHAEKAPPQLVMACIAFSAMQSPADGVRRFGKALHSVLHPYLFQAFENNIIRTRQLQHVQALALFVHSGLWSGDRRRMEISEAVVGSLIQMLRSGSRYRYSTYNHTPPNAADEGEILESKWRSWVESESFKRLAFHMQIHCSEASLTTGNRLPVSCAELLLPLPHHRELWMAETSLEWKEIYLKLNPDGSEIEFPKATIREILSKPLVILSLPNIYDLDLIQTIVLHCISSMIQDYQKLQLVCASDDEDVMRLNNIASESEQQRLRHLLQMMRTINDLHRDRGNAPRSLLIELFSMHLFTPFEQIEVAAGRDGQGEAKAAYRSAQRWIQRSQARNAVFNAGQVVRYIRQIPRAQFTDFHAIAIYQASLCLWIYGSFASTNGHSEADGHLQVANSLYFLDAEDTRETEQWVCLNRGIPAISMVLSNQQPGQGHSISLSSTQEIMIYLRDLLCEKSSWNQRDTLNSAIRELMSALSRARPGFV